MNQARKNTRWSTRDVRGFTLIELLVVISIIALLIAILLPTIKKARFWAQVTACGSNVHQLVVGSLAFANDYDGLLPRHLNLPYNVQTATIWDNNNASVLFPPDPENFPLMSYFNNSREAFFCPGSEFRTVENTQWEKKPVFGNPLQFSYGLIANLNVEGQGGGIDDAASDRLVPRTISDDPEKGLWCDDDNWQHDNYDGLPFFPAWFRANHPGVDYRINPGQEVEGRYLGLLGGSARWDIYAEPDDQSKAQKYRLLMQDNNKFYLAY
ncbi:MAG: hypothetical protein CMJ18_05330 [Phycisphaeraceae bacterium]|nr:hypothetical protein [Phycisphaeraceae bacterium]